MEAGTNTTSIVVNQAPGGASNFSLSGDHEQAEAVKPRNQTPFYVPSDEPVVKVKNQHYSTSFSLAGDYAQAPDNFQSKVPTGK